MHCPFSHRRRAGFLLLEVMLGIGILGTFLSGIGLSLLMGQEHTIMAGDRIHAVQLSQRALEAARAIRDDDFDTLQSAVGAGEIGVLITDVPNRWQLSSPVTVDAQGFRTALTVQLEGPDHLRVQAETKWKRGYNRSGSVLIATDLTDWRSPPAMGNWATVSVQGSGSIAGVTPMFTAAAVAGDYLFATGNNNVSGDELYVINLSSLSNPQFATSLDLGAGGLDLAIRGDYLYVLTDDAAAQLKVYDLSDFPTTPLGSPVSLDLKGEGRGRSFAFRGETLIVGMSNDPAGGKDELFHFNISNPNVLGSSGSLDLPEGDIVSIAVSGTSALLATSDVNAPIRAADARPSSFSFPPGEAHNFPDGLPGTHIAIAAGSIILGRSGIHDLTRLEMSLAGFVPPDPAPPTHDVGGDVHDLAVDPAACVAFTAVGNNSGGVEFQAVRLSNMTSLDFLDKDFGDGRAVVYDTDRDRVYLLTDDAWYVLRPGVGTLDPPCP